MAFTFDSEFAVAKALNSRIAPEARAEALEEAARNCDEGVSWSPAVTGNVLFYVEGTARRLAATIRALAAPTTGEKTREIIPDWKPQAIRRQPQ
jgi:hypothetical protein